MLVGVGEMNAKAELVTTNGALPEMAADPFVQMVERAAANPAVDIGKLERLLDMKERIEARQARLAYNAALSAMQSELPVIEKNGRIVIEKNNTVVQSTPYALFDDINKVILPILKQHGFTLSFRSNVAADGKQMVTGILAHEAGHQEETTVTLMIDSSGSKNSVQAVGSSLSYGKRYATGLLLNLTFKGEDDDGKAADAPGTITGEQAKTLQAAIMEVDADLPQFLKYFRVEKLDDLPESEYGRAIAALQKKAAKK